MTSRTRRQRDLDYDRRKVNELKIAGLSPSQISKKLGKEYKYIKRIYDQEKGDE